MRAALTMKTSRVMGMDISRSFRIHQGAWRALLWLRFEEQSFTHRRGESKTALVLARRVSSASSFPRASARQAYSNHFSAAFLGSFLKRCSPSAEGVGASGPRAFV